MKGTAKGVAAGTAAGNSLAYFAIWWAGKKYGVVFDDPLMAMAMGATLISIFLLELKSLVRWIGGLFSKNED